MITSDKFSRGYFKSGKAFWPVLSIVWMFLIFVTAWCSEGWLQPDEHARVLEPAHMIAYGYASLPWELGSKDPIVSWLVGFVFSPLLMITRIFNLDGLSEAAILRAVAGLFASTRFLAIWQIMKLLHLKQSRRIFYLAVMMLAIFGPLFLVRTSQENIACTFLVWALLVSLRIQIDGLTYVRGIALGVLLALTFSVRPQAGFAAAGLGLLVFYRKGGSIVIPASIGLLLGLLPLAFVDWWTTGIPFYPAYNYARYALSDEAGGTVWGTSPWWYYFPQYFESWYPPLSVLLLLPIFVGLILVPELGAIVLPFTIIHFILGHKETRYFSPMIPFFHLSMFIGIEWLERRSRFLNRIFNARKIWMAALCVLASLTLLAGLFPMNSSPWMYAELGRRIRQGEIIDFTYVGNTTSSFSQFYAKIPHPPKFTQVSWNDMSSGRAQVKGWLAFYALDPEDFFEIQRSCGSQGAHRWNEKILKLITLFPRSPARRRVNTIIFCNEPVKFNQ